MSLTLDEVAQLLAPIWENREVVGIEPIAKGMLNTIYRVTVGRDSPQCIVVRERHFTDPEYGQEFAAERFAYALLDERPSRPLLYRVISSGEGRGVAVFEHVSGHLLDDVLGDPRTSDEEVRRLLLLLGEDLAAIHARPAHGFGTLRRVDYASYEVVAFWSALFQAEVAALARYFPERASRLEEATRLWIDTIAAAPEALVRPCLVHGDVHGRNLLVRDQHIVFIDWESARFRSAAYDLVQLHAIDLAAWPDRAALLRRSYLHARGLPEAEAALVALVRVFTQFWRVRMAIFMDVHGHPGCSYFGRHGSYRAFLEAGDFE